MLQQRKTTAVTISVIANDVDTGAHTLTITNKGTPTNGTTALSGNTIVYTPTANYNGTDQFVYTINDGNGNNASATVDVTITSVNDLPTAVADSGSTYGTTPVTIDLLFNDSDIDGGTLAIGGTSSPANGSIQVSGGTIIYTANLGFEGADSFVYTLSDGQSGTDTATVTVNVLYTDESAVAEALSDLTIGYSGTDSSIGVTNNITLSANGSHNTSINWTSSSTDVIATSGSVGKAIVRRRRQGGNINSGH